MTTHENNDETQRPSLLQLYQAVEAAVSREQVFQILKEHAHYFDKESGIDWQRNSTH